MAAIDRTAFAALRDMSPSKFIGSAAQLCEAGTDGVAFLAQVDTDVIEKGARTLEILRLPEIVLGDRIVEKMRLSPSEVNFP